MCGEGGGGSGFSDGCCLLNGIIAFSSGVFVCVFDLWVKRTTLRWFGHVERMGNEEFVKKVYLSSVEGMERRGRLLGRWKDRVKEYVSERGVRGNRLEWARRECMDRERWRSVCYSHLPGGRFWRKQGIGAID